MNKGYRNVVFVGFTKLEERAIKIVDTRRLKHNWPMMARHLYRFPYVIFLKTKEEALNHQGFAIFIKNNTEEDKEYLKRHLKKLHTNYYHVIICTDDNEIDAKYETISEKSLYEEKIIKDLNSWYYEYLKEENKRQEITNKINLNPKKGDIAINLKEYFTGKDNVAAKEVSSHFKIPLRTAQRYINYMNEIFENVKYDAETKTWIHKK